MKPRESSTFALSYQTNVNESQQEPLFGQNVNKFYEEINCQN